MLILIQMLKRVDPCKSGSKSITLMLIPSIQCITLSNLLFQHFLQGISCSHVSFVKSIEHYFVFRFKFCKINVDNVNYICNQQKASSVYVNYATIFKENLFLEWSFLAIGEKFQTIISAPIIFSIIYNLAGKNLCDKSIVYNRSARKSFIVSSCIEITLSSHNIEQKY